MSDEPSNPPPLNFEDVLKQARRIASRDRFWAARGKAVNAYANLEQALCRVFANVSQMSDERAAIVFFRIASAQARNDILDKLIRLHYGGQYNRFWNSVLRALRPIDIKRNEIVHWVVVTTLPLTVSGLEPPQVMLRPPTFWSALRHEPPQIKSDDLRAFTKICNFYAHAVGSFSWITSWEHRPVVPPSPALSAAWMRIFREPLAYPLPAGTRLPRNELIPRTRRRASPL